ncbi:MAG: urea transporter [Bacteroidales bacterium]|nr:urea transporter [Bacteroidales bacterium]MCM1146742.1 urea transporter [Bacteroidales bacterium]MCM1205559.1 urea transporter [Bacillota bacterium]MCM1509179.1 urea transporter [Clostridium sp.]
MKNTSSFCCSLLRGAGQVMFMGNVNTGALFLAGIIIGSWMSGTAVVAVGAMTGLIASTLTAYLLYKTKEDAGQGLCGYNGILIGCALPTIFDSTIFMWISLTILSAISPWLRELMNKSLKNIGVNALTFPFILLTWLSFCLDLPQATATLPEHIHCITVLTFAKALMNGVSQIFLINSYVCGAFFLVGLLIANWRAAVWCIFGATTGIMLAVALNQDHTAIINGLYGFNPALTAIALGTIFHKNTVLTIIGIIITVFIQITLSHLLSPAGIPELTAPFCIATWIVLIITNKNKVNNQEAECNTIIVV